MVLNKKTELSEIDFLLYQGDRELNLGNPKKSKEHFEKVLEIEPNNTHALLKVGHILGKIGSYNKAIEKYNQVLKNESSNVLALINKGLALHFLEKYTDAISCYDSILKQRPDSTTTLYFKASSLVKDKNIQSGLEVLTKAVKLNPSLRIKAKHDIDFQEIKTNNEFKKITS